jgi:hypothetical protein
MTATCYLIFPRDDPVGNVETITWDADEAERASRNGHRVTAETFNYDL